MSLAPAPQSSSKTVSLNPKTIGAVAVLWAVLAGLAEVHDTQDLAVALAWAITVSTAFVWGIPAITNLQKATGA